jgi:hypothetical protein
MIAALFYLQYTSARNRLVTRFKRLKQPKYLFGAIVGGLYFYFYFFRYLFHAGYARNGRPAVAVMIPSEYLPLAESVAALALVVIVLLAWLLPGERAALTFSEAEVAFLFPAPVTRRTLVHFKLIRSQLRILFSALLLTLFSQRYGGSAWIHALGWWLVLSTVSLHFIGASFARTLLMDHGVSNRFRRLLVFPLLICLAAFIWLWAKKTLPAMTAADTADFTSVLNYVRQLLGAGPALYLLYPFQLLVGPFFAPDAAAFLTALVPALLLFLLHYIWVVSSDVAFEEASVEASQKLAARLAAVRAGNWQAAGKKQKARRAWFQLAATGPAATALMWKNLIGLGQVFSARLWIILAVVMVMVFAGFCGSAHARNFSNLAAIVIAILLGYSLLLGPQLLRLDFRQDLPRADILKTFPLRGWQIALGEVLAPVTVLAGFQWLLLLVGFGLVLLLPGKHEALILSIGISAVVLLPVLDFLMLLIPNAAVLLFPSWIQAGKDSPRGIEATGQRLILAVGQMLLLLLALVPAALAFAAVYFPLKLACGPVAPIPFAALAAAVIVAVEAGLGVRLLGKLFERFDVTEEAAS